MPTSIEDLGREAGFIFRGTVKERGAATLPEVPVTNRTLIVTVDEIIKSPKMLQAFEGKDITVQLGEGQTAQAGQQRIFFTTGWIYGASIAVVSLGHVATTAAFGQRAVAAVQAAPDRAIQERAARAELVVSGRVAEVREVEPPAGEPITEHYPGWCEAVVQVDSVEKGALGDPSTGQVVVRFAASTDVKWHKAPKFEVDQEGVWMLGDAAAEPAARAAMGERPGVYVAVDASDFQPKEQADHVRSVISEHGGNP